MKITKTMLKKHKDNLEFLAHVVQEVNSWDGSLDDFEVMEFDDDFFNTYFEGNPMDAARATYFGEIGSWMDDYIRFNGYGNLESVSKYQREDELTRGADEIIDRAFELKDVIDLTWAIENAEGATK